LLSRANVSRGHRSSLKSPQPLWRHEKEAPRGEQRGF
jgi:hypothetical protein